MKPAKLSQFFGQNLLRLRLPVGLVLLAVTLLMAGAATQVRIATQFIDFFPARHRNVKLYRRYQVFGSAQTLQIMIHVKHGDIFNLDTLDKIQDLTRAVDRLPDINHIEIFSLGSPRVAFVTAVPGGVNSQVYMYPQAPDTEAGVLELKKNVQAHQAALAYLVSADNKNALINAQFYDHRLDYKTIFDRAHALAARYRDANNEIYLSGEPMVRGYGYHYLPLTAAILFAACAAIVLVAYASLGAYSSWWIPLLTSLCTAIWGLGFVGLMGYAFDPLMLVVPFILTARAVSHATQWQRRYYYFLDRLEDNRAACIATTDAMLGPGLVAIVADAAGIIFMSFSGIPVLDSLARIGTAWIASTVLMVLVFQPIMVSYLSLPHHRARREHWQNLIRWLEPRTEKLIDQIVQGGWGRKLLLSGALALLVLGVSSALNVQVGYETPGTPLYRADASVNTNAAAVSQYFPSEDGWIILTAPPFPQPQSSIAPAVLRATIGLGAALYRDPAVRQVISYAAGGARSTDQMFHNGHPKYFAVPDNVQLAGNLWSFFFGSSGPGDLERYFSNVTLSETCVRVLMRDHTHRTLATVQREIGQFLETNVTHNPALSNVRIQYLGGTAGLYAAADDVLYRIDMINIALVLGCLFVFCAWLFRSLSAGVIFVFACVLANFTAFIYMNLSDTALTIDTVPVISLAIGLGVDYAISIVSRVRAEVIAGYGLNDAIHMALTRGGAGVLMTLGIMLAGILPWALSPILFHSHMGILLAVLLLTNALAGLLVIPAFLAWLRPDFICRYESKAQARADTRVAG